MRKKLHKILVVVSVIFSISYICAYLSVHISPQLFWFVAFLGFIFPYLAIVNCVFFIYWAIRRKRIFFFTFFIFLSGIPYLTDIFQYTYSNEKEEGSLKFLSYNVRVFNLYEWKHNLLMRDSIMNLINTEKPDILCIQEYFYDNSHNFKTTEILTDSFKLNYFHDAYTYKSANIHNFGIATFSRYPIVNEGEIRFPETNNICIYTDIKINNDTVRVYNNHLQSVHFVKIEYETIDSLGLKIDSTQITGLMGIFKKLKKSFAKRADQADIISESINQSPYPVFVCGDFNDTPVSYTYQKLSDNLRDAFCENGSGIGTTYIGRFPFLRIDFILHSKQIEISDFRILKQNFSDHYPVSCNFKIMKKNDN
ncbi:MAG: hypothetical protein A2046_11400 [Bacteroidetes bacterium GWA2_30_7]|nr:MAG: hypothetical protein A2046_11400 [Bacteroidetes bacterium GWA2_30_7]